MSNEKDVWRFIKKRLSRGESVMLLIVAESSGSSPGRAGYKMAIASDGELIGSIGGGVMEVTLAERAKIERQAQAVEQIHRKGVDDSSGMICSGRQTVLMRPLSRDDLEVVRTLTDALENESRALLEVNRDGIAILASDDRLPEISFEKTSDTEFTYRERLGTKPGLYIIGGGHCALALSELASKIGFRISIFDDRPHLNTLAKNEFADQITIIESYDRVGAHVPAGSDVYVVVMTLGYASDAVVIRQLIDHELRYFGVLGSKAKMATLMKELRKAGCDGEKLDRIQTPIGLPINSRTPDEIAVSIMAEIIAIKNADGEIGMLQSRFI